MGGMHDGSIGGGNGNRDREGYDVLQRVHITGKEMCCGSSIEDGEVGLGTYG